MALPGVSDMIVQLVVATENRKGQVIPVTGEKFIIGRADDCHLKPRSELISRYHCAILVGENVVVRDLGSKNGVRLNGEKINAEQKLKNGDRLAIGPLEFFVHIAADSETLAKNHPAGDRIHTEADWLHDGTESEAQFAPTLLLDQLKMLNKDKESKTEPGKSATDVIKKFL
jgi:pSer/pThr/pTyr-binding forkhead associated (FHA) protein